MITVTNFTYNQKDIQSDSGCYLFYDENNEILYIGKAKNLRKRVSSYFQKNKKSPKTELLVSKIKSIKTQIVNTETEALILENNLIKQYKPRFNILLRDDKNFLYLRLTKENFPRIEITRRLQRDGSFYVGPKTSAHKFRQTIKFCQKVFQIRTCKLEIQETQTGEINIIHNTENKKIPCMDWHIKKCTGPCTSNITATEYKQSVENMKKFLQGNTTEVISNLKTKMMSYAQTQNFEAAGKTRDLIQSITATIEKQTVQFQDFLDRDFLNFYREDNKVSFVRMVFRQGKYLDQTEHLLRVSSFCTDEELLEKFCLQFYEKTAELPCEIIIPIKIPEMMKVANLISSYFLEKNIVKFIVSQKGDKKTVLDLCLKNAKNYIEKEKIKSLSQEQNFAFALPKLAECLNLNQPLHRIECYDISHFSGSNSVGSQVVFLNGVPHNKEYRRYHIKSLPVGKIDDFAALQEVLTRRFVNLKTEKIPDLIVIDGGKGQLSSVLKIFKKITVPTGFDPHTQIISLAKKEEQIFCVGQSTPIELSNSSPALKLLQRLRDEAHRFAISFNRNLRIKDQKKSILDEITGIGSVTKKKLLKEFGSVGIIGQASDKELLLIINKKQLEELRKYL